MNGKGVDPGGSRGGPCMEVGPSGWARRMCVHVCGGGWEVLSMQACIQRLLRTAALSCHVGCCNLQNMHSP